MAVVVRFRPLPGSLVTLALIALSTSEVHSAPSPPLTMHQVIVRTLESNPRLATFSFQQRMSDGDIIQAGLKPNPVLRGEIENVLGTGALQGLDGAVLSLTLSQVIELGTKRSERTAVAIAHAGLQQADYVITRLDTLAEAARSYIAVVEAQELLNLTREDLELSRKTLAAVVDRVNAGSLSEVEASQARIRVARVRLSVEHVEHELASAKVQLATSWGALEPDFESVAARLFSLPELADFSVIAQQVEDAPSVRRYLAVDRVRYSQLRLAQANAQQDIRVGAGLRRLQDFDESALLFEVSMPLTWNDRNQGNVRKARAQFEMTDLERREERIRLHALLFAMYQETVHARTEATTLQTEVLPEIRKAFNKIDEGFRSGRFSWLERARLADERLEVERQAIQSAARFHTLVVEMEQLTGQPLAQSPFRVTQEAGNES